MKRFLLLTAAAAVLLSLVNLTASTAPHSSFDATADDEEAIRAVIDQQTTTFYDRDLAAYLEVWAKVPHAVRMYPDGERITGWQAVEEHYTQLMMDESAPVLGLVYEPRDIDIQIYDDVAWVINNQHVAGEVSGGPFAGDQWVHRFLEKHDGEWKVVMLLHGVIPE